MRKYSQEIHYLLTLFNNIVSIFTRLLFLILTLIVMQGIEFLVLIKTVTSSSFFYHMGCHCTKHLLLEVVLNGILFKYVKSFHNGRGKKLKGKATQTLLQERKVKRQLEITHSQETF